MPLSRSTLFSFYLTLTPFVKAYLDFQLESPITKGYEEALTKILKKEEIERIRAEVMSMTLPKAYLGLMTLPINLAVLESLSEILEEAYLTRGEYVEEIRDLFNILRGYIIIHIKGVPVFLFVDESGTALTLESASSIVQGCWALALALNRALRMLKRNNKLNFIILIDEPEVHVLPPVQIALAEYMVELTKRYENRLYFVISTHSEAFLLGLTKYAARKNLLDIVGVHGFEGETGNFVIRNVKVFEDGEVEYIEGFHEALKKITIEE